MYVSGVHTGIQAGHSAEEMWVYYTDLVLTNAQPSVHVQIALNNLRDFARSHKTWIVLNGGDHQDLEALASFFATCPHDYPMSSFREPGLNYATTAVRIVVPEKLYDDIAKAIGKELVFEDGVIYLRLAPGNTFMGKYSDEYKARNYSAWELEFLYRKSKCKLAS